MFATDDARLAAAVERAFDSAVAARAEPQSTAAPAFGPMSLGPVSVPWVSASTVTAVSAVWRAVTLISDLVASFPWGEWVDDDKLDAPHRLVRRPLATMTRREWTWRVVATEALHSTVYLLHTGGYDRTDGSPFSLLPLPPATVYAVNPDPWGILPASQYVVAGQQVREDQLTIIRRAPLPGISDELAGVLNIARRQFAAYLAADTHMARYWQNGGPVVTQITTEQALDDGEAEAIAARWQQRRQLGADYPAVFGKGAHAEAWGADPTTESAVDARRDMTAEVGRYFGLPTRILNAPALDSETYANVEADAVDLHRYCLSGYMGPVEDAITDLLDGDSELGHRMVMDPTWFLQGDLTSRATAWAAIVGAEIADTDEARVRGFGLKARGAAQAPAPATEAAQAAAVEV